MWGCHVIMAAGVIITYNYSGTPQSGHSEIRTPRYTCRGQFLPSQILHLCTFQPLESGHPANQDTFLGTKVSGLEGFHCMYMEIL